MAGIDVRISELPAATEGHADDRFETTQVDGATLVSRSITLDQVSDAVAAILPPPAASWDSITGKPATFPPTTPIPYTSISGTPTSLPPSGTAGGDLSGSYPNPLLKPSVTNGQIMTTVGGVSTWAAAPASATLPTGSVGYGDGANLLTGVLANMSFDTTNKRLGINKSVPTASVDIVSTTNNQPVFKGTGVANATTAQNWFEISVADPTGGSGSSFRINGGTTGGLGLFDIDRLGDCNIAGWLRVMQQTATPAGGAYYYGLYIGSSATGNAGLFSGTGAPTLDTFGAYGSLYMDKASPGVPYYNSNGSTGWNRLAPITSVGTTAPANPVDGQLWYYSDASAGGGTLYIRYNDGSSTAWVPASPAATPGSLLQTVYVETGAVATGTTVMPTDDTIPQIGEGNEYMTLTITPRSATSRLIIEVLWNGATNIATAGAYFGVALFQDSTANALAAVFNVSGAANFPLTFGLRHVMTAGTTSATTFRVRAGCGGAGTTTFNGASGGRIFGGVMASSIVIQEVA